VREEEKFITKVIKTSVIGMEEAAVEQKGVRMRNTTRVQNIEIQAKEKRVKKRNAHSATMVSRSHGADLDDTF
jgi:hypothetical protein